ncbi:carbamoyltransferase HypF [Streptomyces sp. NPDC004783]|uniref:carbamoyltransferase HypF n=1 Tax=Streptomyces sp. NPDC004783 TaxID=3154459 RepID=UPI0033A6682F
MSAGQTWRVEVRGTVQGVGFRPFVHRTADALGLDGWVRNVDGHVIATVAGPPDALGEFVTRCQKEAPPLAVVDTVRVRHLETTGAHAVTPGSGFAVLESATGAATGPVRQVPADTAPCADCLRELFTPGDRRYRYPFINCTACGPRSTVITDLPYDRARTTMREFTLCAACAAEYADPTDRRYHAEPMACPRCGPRTSWWSPDAACEGEEALNAAAEAVLQGRVVALKGVGGYQLVCDATDAAVVATLRHRKHRPDKPFAVMVPDLTMARRLARIGPVEHELLGSAACPIVLLPSLPASPLAAGVHPGTRRVGLLLPAGPLHHLLARAVDRPVVCTSGNLADEPLIIDDAEARTRLAGVADGFLTHDRAIHTRCDDSVATTLGRRVLTIRRARGYVPTPMGLPVAGPLPALAVGAQLKHTFTLAAGERAVIGPHTGDLADLRTLNAFEKACRDLSQLAGIDPQVVVHDLHPEYVSTRWATSRWPAERRLAVQHHHAHVAACAAEHGLSGPFTGVALDGLGFGDDGTLWGGEVLVADLKGYRRVARFGTAPLPGGEAAVRAPFRMALGYLFGAEDLGSAPPSRELVETFTADRPADEVRALRVMVVREVNCPRASSCGRLFDAAASILGLCHRVSYEGQAAVALESVAGDPRQAPGPGPLPWRLVRSGDGRDALWVYDPLPTLTALLRGRRDGEPIPLLAAGFHSAVAAATAALVIHAVEDGAPPVVCLSGGCFQNIRLLGEISGRLRAAGLEVLVGSKVPVNDGGISFGQAAVAAARLAQGREGREEAPCAWASRDA